VLTYKEGSEITSKLLQAGALGIFRMTFVDLYFVYKPDIISPPLLAEVVTNRIGTIIETLYLKKKIEELKEENYGYDKIIEEKDALTKDMNSLQLELKDKYLQLMVRGDSITTCSR
jgi:hypothetical protein